MSLAFAVSKVFSHYICSLRSYVLLRTLYILFDLIQSYPSTNNVLSADESLLLLLDC